MFDHVCNLTGCHVIFNLMEMDIQRAISGNTVKTISKTMCNNAVTILGSIEVAFCVDKAQCLQTMP